MKCSIARALDIIGERWTILLVRELLTGPKRFKDLMLGLSGIGTNLLADRLKALKETGLIQKDKESGDLRYELTNEGKELEPALVYLARWGLKYGAESAEDDLDLPNWNILAFKAIFDSESASGVREIYEIHVGDFVFSMRVWDGKIETRFGADWKPDLTVRFSDRAFSRLARRESSLEDEEKSGDVVIEGSVQAKDRFTNLFSLEKVLHNPLAM